MSWHHHQLLCGWGKGGNVASAGWQLMLCDATWHVSSRTSRDTPVVKLYAIFNTLTCPELRTYQILKFVHNCIYHQNKLPYIFSNYFTQNYMLYIITPALESTFILNRYTVSWGRDLSNLKEVVYETLSRMNSGPSYLPTHSLSI